MSNQSEFNLFAAGLGQRIAEMGGGALMKFQVFTSSGTFTPTTKAISNGGQHFAILVGGGGGGGGGFSSNAKGADGGGGGVVVCRPLTITSAQTVTVGAGGTGGASGGGNGTDGGNSSIGSLLTAPGGQGGQDSSNTQGLDPWPNGNGGTINGSTNNIAAMGRGGHSYMPGGSLYAAKSPPTNGGGGGGGGRRYVSEAGQNGTAGICIIWWFE